MFDYQVFVIHLWYVSIPAKKCQNRTSDPLCNGILEEKAQLYNLYWHFIKCFTTIFVGAFLQGTGTSEGNDSLSALTGSIQFLIKTGKSK